MMLHVVTVLHTIAECNIVLHTVTYNVTYNVTPCHSTTQSVTAATQCYMLLQAVLNYTVWC